MSVLDAASALRVALADFDPSCLDGAGCAGVVAALARTEKVCAYARARAAARAVECGAHQAAGCADPGDWLARKTGSTTADARAALATASSLDGRAATEHALAAGDISLAQAKEIVRTETEAPGCEADLVAAAADGSLDRLRDVARDRRLAAADPAELHRRQHAARMFRSWRDELGMTCFRGALPPETGVAFINRLDAETDRIRRAARQTGSTDRRDAHAADALIQLLAESGGNRRAAKTELIIVCDLNAYRRGHAHDGEPCHIVGGGPIPVEIAKQLSKDAFLKAILHNGTDIHLVAHFGRHIPAPLLTALQSGGPPSFLGAVCDFGCGRRTGLQWDHLDPVANGGPTSANNLSPKFWACHEAKTEHDRQAGLLGPNPPTAASFRTTKPPGLAPPNPPPETETLPFDDTG